MDKYCTQISHDEPCKLAKPPLCKHLHMITEGLVLVYTTSRTAVNYLCRYQTFTEMILSSIFVSDCEIAKYVLFCYTMSLLTSNHLVLPHSDRGVCSLSTDSDPEQGTSDCYQRDCLMAYHNISYENVTSKQ